MKSALCPRFQHHAPPSRPTAGTFAPLRASIHGTFEITTAGTTITSIALDVAAAAVVNAGSYFECIYLGPTAALGGSWS